MWHLLVLSNGLNMGLVGLDWALVTSLLKFETCKTMTLLHLCHKWQTSQLCRSWPLLCSGLKIYRTKREMAQEVNTVPLITRNNSTSTANWHLWHTHPMMHLHKFMDHTPVTWQLQYTLTDIVPDTQSPCFTHTNTPTHTCQYLQDAQPLPHTLTHSCRPLPTSVTPETCQSRRSSMGFI